MQRNSPERKDEMAYRKRLRDQRTSSAPADFEAIRRCAELRAIRAREVNFKGETQDDRRPAVLYSSLFTPHSGASSSRPSPTSTGREPRCTRPGPKAGTSGFACCTIGAAGEGFGGAGNIRFFKARRPRPFKPRPRLFPEADLESSDVKTPRRTDRLPTLPVLCQRHRLLVEHFGTGSPRGMAMNEIVRTLVHDAVKKAQVAAGRSGRRGTARGHRTRGHRAAGLLNRPGNLGAVQIE